jgi:membrane peptidoglycan carboxypeptidase
MRSRQEEARRKGRTIAIRKEWVDFVRIPALLKEAVRITEDASFYWHKGIDFEEIKESLKRDLMFLIPRIPYEALTSERNG